MDIFMLQMFANSLFRIHLFLFCGVQNVQMRALIVCFTLFTVWFRLRLSFSLVKIVDVV